MCPSWQRFKVFAKYEHLGVKLGVMKYDRISCYHFNPDTLREFVDSAAFTKLLEAHFHGFTLTPADIAVVLKNTTTIRSLAFHGSILVPESDGNLDRM